MSSRTVNIVCSHYPPHSGGIERFAYLQAKAMVKMGLKVNVITNDTDKLGFSHLEEGIEVYRLSFFGLFDDRLPIPYRMKQLTTVYKLCFSHQIDLVIVHGRYYPLSLLGCIASQMRTCRLLLIDHSSGYIGFSNHLLSFFSRLYEHAMTSALKLFAPRFYGVSGACNKWLLNFGIKAKGIWYNGIDWESQVAPIPDIKTLHGITGKKVILTVGRLVPEKGITDFVQCFDNNRQLQESYTLIVIGAGVLENTVRDVSNRNPSVIYLGRQSHQVVLAYMQQADVYVNPSNYPEGLPTVILEAGRFGKPVISTANGGAAEVISNGRTGLIVDNYDCNDIVRSLVYLSNNPDEAAILGMSLRELVLDRFTFESITKDIIDTELELNP